MDAATTLQPFGSVHEVVIRTSRTRAPFAVACFYRRRHQVIRAAKKEALNFIETCNGSMQLPDGAGLSSSTSPESPTSTATPL